MAVGAFLEPFVVVSLLFGGAWFNRNKDYDFWKGTQGWAGGSKRSDDFGGKRGLTETSSPRSPPWSSGSSSPTLGSDDGSPWSLTTRRRNVRILGFKTMVTTPNTLVFKDRFLSRVLQKFPFLVEAWYWALIYWVYQLGRAFTAVTIVQGTVHVARKHALELVHLEQRLGIFWEVAVQQWFLERPVLLHWINRVYSFIHIPGTIFFLVALFYLTTSRKRRAMSGRVRNDVVSAGPALYEARRRTMAMCNLIAFVVFTLWPCMPPRLLSDPNYNGPAAAEAKSFGFVDSVHSTAGESSVWTTNRFCNQYAAMPSLHFGYSLLIGLTIATLPINGVRPNSWKRLAIGVVGLSYPALILTAIVATANHFILDAVAGAMVCGIAWHANGLLLNLCVLEDYLLWVVRIHKPVNYTDPETAVEPDYHPILLSEEV
ncbi:PAP2 superfamily domain-containing protein [Trichoderma longibrachiatum]